MGETTAEEDRRRVTIRDLREMKGRGEKIAALTCYDHLFARLLSGSDLDLVLVGDSVAQGVLGYDSTLPVTLDQMIHHASAVRRGLSGPLLVVDLPFLTYQVSDAEAVRSGGRVLKETGADAVKVEGGDPATLDRVRALMGAGVPVMGHLGLTPQSIRRFGGYGVRGRETGEAERMREQADALEEAGCFAVVLEMVPAQLAREITDRLTVPTVGIGAGAACDGQVLVLHDMLGLEEGFDPAFLRRFADLAPEVRRATDDFVGAVKSGDFPSARESYE